MLIYSTVFLTKRKTLNFEFYPYDNLNLNFVSKNRYAVLLDMYARFHKSYYGNLITIVSKRFLTWAYFCNMNLFDH